MKKINLPLTAEDIKNLKTCDEVLLTGVVYTARDTAHKRMADAIKKNKKPPFNIKNQIIYYCGPTPKPVGKIIGSCGPTTSKRMDEFTPLLLKNGLKAMIGKGKRCEKVRQAIKKYKGVYFIAIGGIGALLSKKVEKVNIVAYKELGAEAIHKLQIKDFPVIVGIDYSGKSIYLKNNKSKNTKDNK